ncbi:light-harvesting complex-like protein OHP1, chloroplastic [Mangifera indica]|uniref:light-harvesting complex-like protein OHP1, chloroplastic n=1 Tax=Mangifera indica TaxID=29780 RepID=UPI001CFBBB37|nr:light-harvesting complex-like protein OHP1, chloroplastic [Mangifera indica]
MPRSEVEIRWQLNEAVVMVCETTAMATSSLLPTNPLISHRQNHQLSLFRNHNRIDSTSKKRPFFRVRAVAKPPAGLELPKVQPKFQAPFLGFTRTAEIWNSRACMIGLIGTFIVELILNKGILQVVGVDVGRGLNLPL